MKKNAKKFHCAKCDFLTSNKYDFNRHLSTAKHKMDKKNAKNEKKNARACLVTECKTGDKKYRCPSGRTYKYQSGLCKHRHKCLLLNKFVFANLLFIYKILFSYFTLIISLYNNVLSYTSILSIYPFK